VEPALKLTEPPPAAPHDTLPLPHTADAFTFTTPPATDTAHAPAVTTAPGVLPAAEPPSVIVEPVVTLVDPVIASDSVEPKTACALSD
jgi:hypothetical protein